MRLNDWVDPKMPPRCNTTTFIAAMASLSTAECGFDIDTVAMPKVDTSRHESIAKKEALMTDLWSVCGVDAKEYPVRDTGLYSVASTYIMRNACMATGSWSMTNNLLIFDRDNHITCIGNFGTCTVPLSYAFVYYDKAVVIINGTTSQVSLYFEIEGRFIEVDTFNEFHAPRNVTAGMGARSVWVADDGSHGITRLKIVGFGRNARLGRAGFVPIEALPLILRGPSNVRCSIPRWSFHKDMMTASLCDDLGLEVSSHSDNVQFLITDADIKTPCPTCGVLRRIDVPDRQHNCRTCRMVVRRKGIEPTHLPPLSANYATIEFGRIRFVPGTNNCVVAADWITVMTIHNDAYEVMGILDDPDSMTITPTGRCAFGPFYTNSPADPHHMRSICVGPL